MGGFLTRLFIRKLDSSLIFFYFFIFYLTLLRFERTYTFQTDSLVSGKPKTATSVQLTIVSTNFLCLTASFQFMYGTLFFLATVFSRFFNEIANLIFVFSFFLQKYVLGSLEGWECCNVAEDCYDFLITTCQ